MAGNKFLESPYARLGISGYDEYMDEAKALQRKPKAASGRPNNDGFETIGQIDTTQNPNDGFVTVGELDQGTEQPEAAAPVQAEKPAEQASTEEWGGPVMKPLPEESLFDKGMKFLINPFEATYNLFRDPEAEKARSMNEYAARKVAEEQGISVDDVYERAGFERNSLADRFINAVANGAHDAVSSQVAEIADAQAYKIQQLTSEYEKTKDPAIKQEIDNLTSSLNSNLSSIQLRQQRKQANAKEMPPSKASQEFINAESFGDAAEAFYNEPLTILAEVIGGSLPYMSEPMQQAMIGGSLFGTKGLMVGTGVGSFNTDAAAEFFGALQEEGVNVSNPESLRTALNNRELINGLKDRAYKHAAVVGLFDALSAGLGTKVLAPVKMSGAGRQMTNAIVQMPAQGTMGGLGEAGGQLYSGQELQPGQIAAEVVGELAPTEVATAALTGNQEKNPESQLINEIGMNIDNAQPVVSAEEAARQSLDPNNAQYQMQTDGNQAAANQAPSGATPVNPAPAGPIGRAVQAGQAVAAEQAAVAEAEAEAAQTTASVPVMITNAMRAQLRDLGYDDAAVSTMTPEQAWGIIEADQPAEQPAQSGPAELQPNQRVRVTAPYGEVEGVISSLRGDGTVDVKTDDGSSYNFALNQGVKIEPVEAPVMGDSDAGATNTADRADNPGMSKDEADQQAGGAGVQGSDLGESVGDNTGSPVSGSGPGVSDGNLSADSEPALAENLVYKNDGSPFASEKAARQAAKNRKLKDHDPVQVDGGFALQPAATNLVADNKAVISETPAESDIAQPVKSETGKTGTVTTPAGRNIDVEYQVVEASSLTASNDESGAVNPAYPQALQPRDRSRAASQDQVNSISANINPRLLGEGPSTTDGAPIVSADGVVESGNGRTLAIRRAYEQNGKSAQDYRNWLAEQGHDVEGMKQPMLVRVRRSDMSEQELIDYTRESNQRTTLEMSSTEQAMSDARDMDAIIGDFAGGDVNHAANRDFVRKFLRDVVGESERGGMVDGQGLLSQDGRRRVEAAMLAAAYGDADLVNDVFESTDTDIKAIGGALLDAAGKWAQMRQATKDNAIAEGMDLTDGLIEAVNLVRRARAEGKKLNELINTTDMFAGDVDPMTEAFLRVFYRGDAMRRARGRDKVAGALIDYADQALATQPGEGLFGDVVTSNQVMGTVHEKLNQQEGQQTADLFTPGQGADAERAGQSGGSGSGPRTETASEAPAQADEDGQSATEQDSASAESVEPSSPTKAPKPKKKPRTKKPKAPSTVERMENYFRPDRIVAGYGGDDKVIAFHPGEDGHWSVTVARVDNEGKVIEAERTHSTQPSNMALAKWEREHPVGEKIDIKQDSLPENNDADQPATNETPPVAASKVSEIDDYGERLEGARKFMEFNRDVSEDDLATLPLSKIWPKNAFDGIQEPLAKAFAHAARAEIPPKPRKSYKVKRWVETVQSFRTLMGEIIEGLEKGNDVTRELMDRMGAKNSLKGFVNKVELMVELDPAAWDRLGAVEEYPDSFRYGDNNEKIPSPSVYVGIDGRGTRFDGKSWREVLPKIKEALGEAKADKKMAFEIRGSKGRYFINKKGDREYRHLADFDDLAEARNYLKDNHAELVAAWDDVKERDNVGKGDVRNKDNRPRTGKDYRNGKNVTPEQFTETFGFRGIQFGNWVKQGKNSKERQGMLNLAYDALMDLADIVGIEPKAISLNGDLGLAFGARGSGNAAAHFEAGSLVINLTKTQGAGSLAHEWFHAVDNYFQRKRGTPKTHNREDHFVTYRPEPLYAHKGNKRSKLLTRSELERYQKLSNNSAYYHSDNWEKDTSHPKGVRPEVEVAFANLVKVLNDSPMRGRALTIDKGKSDGYWSRIIERAARSFENYVIARMDEKGYNNDYLANVTRLESFKRNPGRYPYLLESEVAPVAEAFNTLFDTIETRETDRGVEMYSIADEPVELSGEGDVKNVETGKPVAFWYRHNTESATDLFGTPKKDAPFGRYYEPSGRYVNVASKSIVDEADDRPTMTSGHLVLQNPLVIQNDSLKWKERLSKRYGGKRGKALSKAIIADGYDGVITLEGDRYISEVLDLTTFDESKAKFSLPSTGPFYSQMIGALDAKLPGSGTAEQIKQQIHNLAKKGDFKQEELEWSGIDEWLDGQAGRVSKADVMEFLRANQIEVQEVSKGGKLTESDLGWTQKGNTYSPSEKYRSIGYIEYMPSNGKYRYNSSGGMVESFQTLEAAKKSALKVAKNKRIKPTKFAQYQLPGGENYQELLLTLPKKNPLRKLSFEQWHKQQYGTLPSEISDRLRYTREEDFNNNRFGDTDSANYKSGHWDESNVLAHIRFNERTDADGNRVLFIEEVQSDWHQAGRREGYAKPETKLVDSKISDWSMITEEDGAFLYTHKASDYKMRLYDGELDWIKGHEGELLTDEYFGSLIAVIEVEETTGTGVPDAPFKTTWPLLAMKRMIRYAAENGFDRIAWTTGEQQADRYDLSKQIDSIRVGKNSNGITYYVQAHKDGEEVLNRGGMEKGKLAEMIGKELADRAISDIENNIDNKVEYSGIDLKVGDSGMKGFYDKILPATVNKYVKKWGGKVGKIDLVKKDAINFDHQELFDYAIRYMNGEVSAEELIDDTGINITENEVEDLIGGAYQPGERQEFIAEEFADDIINRNRGTGDSSQHSLDITTAMRDAAMAGQPLFSTSQPNRGSFTSSTLDQHLRGGSLGGIIGALIDDGQIVLHDTAQSMPGKASGAQAMTGRDGRVHLVADQLSARNVMGVALHEAFHSGAETLLGSEQWNKLMGSLKALYNQSQRSGGKARTFFDKAQRRVENAKRAGARISDALAIEEFGAYTIEEYENAPRSLRIWVDNLVGAIKAWLLQRFGKQVGQVTPAQLRSIAIAAMRDQAAQTAGRVAEVFSTDNGTGITVEEVSHEEFFKALEEQQQRAAERSAGTGRGADAQEPKNLRTVSGRAPRQGWAAATRASLQGRPVLLYRGAANPLSERSFTKERLGGLSGHPTSGLGVWSTISQGEANRYAGKHPGGVTEAVYFDVRNPKVYRDGNFPTFDSIKDAYQFRERLRSLGHDGIMHDLSGIGGEIHFVAFDAEQVIHAGADDKFSVVFHGTPHTFDQFSLDAIGTGEGAQAYGWGLYFAGNKQVAEWYRESLSTRYDAVSEWAFKPVNDAAKVELSEVINTADAALMYASQDLSGMSPNKISNGLRAMAEKANDRYADAYNKMANMVDDGRLVFEEPKGNLYQVDIPDDEHLLDWDKPLNMQPDNVKELLKKAGIDPELATDLVRYENDIAEKYNVPDASLAWKLMTDAEREKMERLQEGPRIIDGKEFYRKIAFGGETIDKSQGIRAASKYLSSIGIPGLRYLDGTSRGKGEGNYNYVIWDESVVTVQAVNDELRQAEEQEARYSIMDQEDASVDPSIDRGKMRQFIDKAIYYAQDKFSDLKGVQKKVGDIPESQDAYLAEELFHGRARKRLDLFDENFTQPLLTLVHETGLDIEQVEEWLHARHAEEANRELAKRNPSEQTIRDEKKKAQDQVNKLKLKLREAQSDGHATRDLERALAAAERDLKMWKQAKPFKGTEAERNSLAGMSDETAAEILAEHADNEPLQRIGNMVDDINNSRLMILGYEELMTADEINTIRGAYEHYVPLHREEVQARMAARGQGFNVKGKEIKRRTGSLRRVDNILPHLVSQYQATLVRAEKARVHRALYRLAVQNPDASFWQVNKSPTMATVGKDGLVTSAVDPRYKEKDNVLTVKVQGEEYTIEFNEKNPYAMRIAAAMKNLEQRQMNFLLQGMAQINRLLSAVNTGWNPQFVLSNAARDFQTAIYNLGGTGAEKIALKMTADYPKAMKGIHNALRGDKSHPWATHFDEFEREGGRTGWMEHMDSIDDARRKLMREFNTLGDSKRAMTKRQLLKLTNFVKDYNDVVENSIRLSAFVNARRAGLTPSKAASLAKNLTVNFNRKGAAGPALNAAYLFYNASIQGSFRMVQSMATSRRTQKFVVATIALAMIMDMVNRAMSDDDDDGIPFYDKIPEYVKERNFIIMGSDDNYFSIPLPWGYNIFHVIGQSAGEAMTKDNFKPLNAASRIFSAVAGAFNPIGSDGSLMQIVAPTVFDPAAQISENKNWAGNKLMPENHGFGADKPDSQLYWSNARKTSRDVAEKINEITGGNAAKPGLVDISPETIDLWIDFMTGGAGKTVADTIDTTSRLMTGEDIERKNVPLLSKVYGKVSPRFDQSEYYDHITEIRTLEAQLDAYENNPDMMEKIEAANAPLLGLINESKMTQKYLKKLRKFRDEAKMEDEKETVKEIEAQMSTIFKEFNKSYRDAVSD